MAVDEASRFLKEFQPCTDLGEAIKAAERGADETPMAFYARVAADKLPLSNAPLLTWRWVVLAT